MFRSRCGCECGVRVLSDPLGKTDKHALQEGEDGTALTNLPSRLHLCLLIMTGDNETGGAPTDVARERTAEDMSEQTYPDADFPPPPPPRPPGDPRMTLVWGDELKLELSDPQNFLEVSERMYGLPEEQI